MVRMMTLSVRRPRSVLALPAILVTLLLGPITPAGATYAGSNGEIVYGGPGSGVFGAFDPDGSNDRAYLTANQPSDLSFSSDGSKAVIVDYGKHTRRISLVDLGTQAHTVVLKASDAPTNEIYSVSLSPDGSTIAFCDGFPHGNVWTIGSDGTGLTRIAKGYCYPDWGANGRIVASKGVFHDDGDRRITTMDPDGANRQTIATMPPIKLSYSIVYALLPSWSPDAQTVVFAAQTTRIRPDIWSVSVHGKKLHRLTRTRNIWETHPVISPDGTKIVYERRQKNFTFDEGDVWLMDTTGANRTDLFSKSTEIWPLAWRPV